MSNFHRKPVPHGIVRICGQCKQTLTIENCNNDTLQVGNEVLVVCTDCYLTSQHPAPREDSGFMVYCADCQKQLEPVDPDDQYYQNEENKLVCYDCYHRNKGNKLPPGQGKRDKIRPRHDLIPVEFLDEIASIFEEGRRPRPGLPEGYGDCWKAGGDDFLRDCLNHASNHLHRAMNGDKSENNLAKAAWGCLVVRWHELKKEEK